MDTINKQACRLCLKLIYYNNFALLETIATRMLDSLLLKLNMEVSLEPVMCNECEESLQKSFDFKLALLNMGNKLMPIINHDEIVQICNVSEDHTACRLCMRLIGRESLTPLFETKENMFLVDILKKHILELDLNDPEEFLTCTQCIEYLKNLVGFIWNCLEVEEKISNYIEIEEKNIKGQIELYNVAECIKPLLKDEISSNTMDEVRVQHRYDEKEEITTEIELKYEDIVESNVSASNVKMEEINTKFEDGEDESFLDNAVFKSSNSRNFHKCNKCTYKTKNKTYLKNHMIIHKDQSKITWHKCPQCPFQTKHKVSLKTHSLIHKIPSEVTMFRCHTCSYETKHKGNLIKHLVIHKKSSELTMYKCDKCTFETKHRNSINDHMLLHKDQPIVYQCDECIYMTNNKRNMKMHMLRHRQSPESTKLDSIQRFSCDICSYKAKYRRSIKLHMITHASTSEAIMYKCEICPYEAKRKHSLKRHMLSHDPTEMYKCDMCSYESKDKKGIRYHIHTKHKRLSEVTMYKCKMCTFETVYKGSFKTHEITHKDPSEIVMYKCTWCLHKSKHKGAFNKHLLTHRIYNPIYQNVYQ